MLLQLFFSYHLANDNYVWRHLLRRAAMSWHQITDERNPDAYIMACSTMSYKDMCALALFLFTLHLHFSYLRCDPRHSPEHSGTIPQRVMNMLTGQTRRVIMFGPGLESSPSKIVRHMLTDEHMHDLRNKSGVGPFKVREMLPSAHAGIFSFARGVLFHNNH